MTDIKYTGNNCIDVYRYGTDRFKTESISIYFSLPTVKEKSVARSLLLSVLKRGTERFPTQKLINERLDELYATLVNLKNQKFDDVQLLGISADIIYSEHIEKNKDILPEVLDLINQMLFCPRLDSDTGMFCEEFINSEKENYKSIILSQINEPRTYAAIRCREEMFASLGITDSLETMCQKIEDTTASEIYDCYLELKNSAKILAFYVGKREADEVREHLENAFGKREFEIVNVSAQMPKLLENLKEPNVVVEQADISQGRLVMGLNCGITWRDDEYYATLLFNEILGASPISKLMINVREKLSLCYECSSVYNSARGSIFVTTGIDSENYELAKSAIIEQVDDMRAGKISETEFSAAKKSIFNVYSAVLDSPSAIERFYLGRIINEIEVDIPDFLEKIQRVTLDQIIAVAKKINLHTVFFLQGEQGVEEDFCNE